MLMITANIAEYFCESSVLQKKYPSIFILYLLCTWHAMFCNIVEKLFSFRN